MVTVYCWAWDLLALKYGDYAQWDSLGDTNFSFVCVYPLEIASWLRIGTHVYFPNLMQEPCLVWTCAGFMQAVTVLFQVPMF